MATIHSYTKIHYEAHEGHEVFFFAFADY